MRIRGAADGLDALTAGVGSGYLCSAPSEDLQVAIETESHRQRPEFCISSPVSPAAETYRANVVTDNHATGF